MSAATHDLWWNVHNKGYRAPHPHLKKTQWEGVETHHIIILNLHCNLPHDPQL